jgi:hypothetical protein
MHCLGFETTTPASEQAKTLHALDRSATVTDTFSLNFLKSQQRLIRATDISLVDQSYILDSGRTFPFLLYPGDSSMGKAR